MLCPHPQGVYILVENYHLINLCEWKSTHDQRCLEDPKRQIEKWIFGRGFEGWAEVQQEAISSVTTPFSRVVIPLGASGPDLGHFSQFHWLVSDLIKGRLCLPSSHLRSKDICLVLLHVRCSDQKRKMERVPCCQEITKDGKDHGFFSPRLLPKVHASSGIIEDAFPS